MLTGDASKLYGSVGLSRVSMRKSHGCETSGFALLSLENASGAERSEVFFLRSTALCPLFLEKCRNFNAARTRRHSRDST